MAQPMHPSKDEPGRAAETPGRGREAEGKPDRGIVDPWLKPDTADPVDGPVRDEARPRPIDPLQDPDGTAASEESEPADIERPEPR